MEIWKKNNKFEHVTGSGKNKAFREYFDKVFNREIEENVFKNFLKMELNPEKRTTKIAWDFFILLTTSVLANKSQGKVSEAIASLKRIFDEGKKLLLLSENNSLLNEVILMILNTKIRPILTGSRQLPMDELSSEQEKKFWSEIDKVRRELVEDKYLLFISFLSLSEQDNEAIKRLIYEEDKEHIKSNILEKKEML